VGKLKNIPEIANLAKEEVELIIDLMIRWESGVMVRDEFERLKKKTLEISVIEQVASKYIELLVSKQKESEIKHDGIPIAQKTSRFRMLQNLFEEANKVTVRDYFKISQDDYLEIKKKDSEMQLKCVQTAHKFYIELERLEIDRAKADLPQGTALGGKGTVTDFKSGVSFGT
jgi:hypothetical protein